MNDARRVLGGAAALCLGAALVPGCSSSDLSEAEARGWSERVISESDLLARTIFGLAQLDTNPDPQTGRLPEFVRSTTITRFALVREGKSYRADLVVSVAPGAAVKAAAGSAVLPARVSVELTVYFTTETERPLLIFLPDSETVRATSWRLHTVDGRPREASSPFVGRQ